MKYYSLFLLLAVGFGLGQCTLSGPPPAPARIDYDQESVKLMNELTPQMSGTWQLRRVEVKRQTYNNLQAQAGIRKDTVLQDLATLTLKPATKPRYMPKNDRHAEFEGRIQRNGRSYPVSLYMSAEHGWLAKKTGPQAYFSFGFFFPTEPHITEPEEALLSNLGLVDDVFTLETTVGQPTMIWKGLSRGISQIDLQKQ